MVKLKNKSQNFKEKGGGGLALFLKLFKSVFQSDVNRNTGRRTLPTITLLIQFYQQNNGETLKEIFKEATEADDGIPVILKGHIKYLSGRINFPFKK